jgi:hypothetical protein
MRPSQRVCSGAALASAVRSRLMRAASTLRTIAGVPVPTVVGVE